MNKNPEIYVMMALDEFDQVVGFVGTKIKHGIDNPWRHYCETNMTLVQKSNGTRTLTFPEDVLTQKFIDRYNNTYINEILPAYENDDLTELTEFDLLCCENGVTHFERFLEPNWQFRWWEMCYKHPNKIFGEDPLIKY